MAKVVLNKAQAIVFLTCYSNLRTKGIPYGPAVSDAKKYTVDTSCDFSPPMDQEATGDEWFYAANTALGSTHDNRSR